MVEEGHPSRYVKLTKDQDAPGEDIRPGELNQPVHVPQLEGRRCGECGQVLPESYEPPSDEPWTTGIFGCTDDPESLSNVRHILEEKKNIGVGGVRFVTITAGCRRPHGWKFRVETHFN